jgi:lipoprotein NlpD
MRLYETERNGMPQRRFMPILILVVVAATAVLLQACGTPAPAPIVSREYRQPRVRNVQPARHYVVRRGDTLYSIAWKYGIDHRQLAGWNRIPYPYTIYPGQQIVVAAPSGRRTPAPRASPRPPVPTDRKPSAAVTAANKPQTSSRRDDVTAANVKLRWQWPTKGKVTRTFSAKDQTRKGIQIAGQFGQEVQAAESGKVVYSGSGLIGYGKLIIVKHNGEYLSAYGHNRKLLVKEGDQVSRGMRIAEMGKNGASGAVLHFEVRHNGIPVDPLALLPRR